MTARKAYIEEQKIYAQKKFQDMQIKNLRKEHVLLELQLANYERTHEINRLEFENSKMKQFLSEAHCSEEHSGARRSNHSGVRRSEEYSGAHSRARRSNHSGVRRSEERSGVYKSGSDNEF